MKVNAPHRRSSGRRRKTPATSARAAAPVRSAPKPRQRPLPPRRPPAAARRPPLRRRRPPMASRIFSPRRSRGRIAADKGGGLDLAPDQGLRPAWPDRSRPMSKAGPPPRGGPPPPPPHRPQPRPNPQPPAPPATRDAHRPAAAQCAQGGCTKIRPRDRRGRAQRHAARRSPPASPRPSRPSRHFYLRREIRLDALMAFRAS